MGLNDTPLGERRHIGFFGLRNAGKSSLVNAMAGQDLSVVSSVAGTTTDPVFKTMELLPIGPVVIADTPGIDDDGELGSLRVEKTKQVLRRCDIAVLVVPAGRKLCAAEEELISLFDRLSIEYVVARTKADLVEGDLPACGEREVSVSVKEGRGVWELKERLARLEKGEKRRRLVADLIDPGSVVVLVIPIDSSAPKGRLILPQQMAVRDILDANGLCMACQLDELEETLAMLKNPPQLVISDSQVFKRVASVVPGSVPLTSFSILMARFKGNLETLSAGAGALARLDDDSRVLVSEGCTHHRQCEDIGTVKIPQCVRDRCGASPSFYFTSGGTFPDDLTDFDLVIHCGGCMLNEREMNHRIKVAESAGVPIVNYGVAIAYMNGILPRCLEPLKGEMNE